MFDKVETEATADLTGCVEIMRTLVASLSTALGFTTAELSPPHSCSLTDKQKSTLQSTIQQLSDVVLGSPATPWTELPEFLFEAVVEHMQDDRKASANFRLVCHAWREAHDRLVSALKPKGAPPDASVWKKLGGVKTVDLHKTLVNDDDLRALTPLSGLTSLNLGFCERVTDEGVRALTPLTGLTSLNLSTTEVTDGGVRALAQLTGLTNLNLEQDEDVQMRGEGVTDKGVRSLAMALTRLTSLNLRDNTSVTDEGVKMLALLTALTRRREEVDLHKTLVNDDDLRALTPLSGLTSLNLGFCERVTDEGVRALTPLTGLTSLNLSTTEVTDGGVRALAQLTRLTSLDLGSCEEITDKGVRALALLTGLTNLNLEQDEDVQMRGEGVTDKGVRSLAMALTRLTSLNLRDNTSVTDEGVKMLALLTALTNLNL
eukprot:CAMPEP_0198231626 /NCGR_PEP_ID=MMETSP1445-20131203/115297_1 /TAXON_ID=36898 /ORGANISM="Pyramimonas sp., Strain CCMP2087" /LENGTH=430 /DNA_ID=CAMNT_0043912251 /DNA_START=321 /DNA_END=1611 /DNA_ORIENTATION=+